MKDKANFGERWLKRKDVINRLVKIEYLKECLPEEKIESEELWEMINYDKFDQQPIKDELLIEHEILYKDPPLEKDEPIASRLTTKPCKSNIPTHYQVIEEKKVVKRRKRRRRKHKADIDFVNATLEVDKMIKNLEEANEELELIALLGKYKNTSNVNI